MGENFEKRKQELKKTIDEAASAIDLQLDDYQEKGKKILVIGSIILAAYSLANFFIESDHEATEEKRHPTTPEKKSTSVITTAATGILTSLLATLAKKQIQGFIENFTKKND
jgi:F0F1-type ATP synthase membrane subunit a